ncbi:hypothetical protein [Pseudoalteromonas umbrosa]|uniref:hypothetical protein n=1 Tax=Pseudoalteromonas umbrosa TaxID=3048489 RepID=UPI0024C348DD|nr:hypothetical protein [Pseudoalteromonas sp. B95]MDK1286353.1 hypothetical protein [Pseudoalteromonas sp. B95]
MSIRVNVLANTNFEHQSLPIASRDALSGTSQNQKFNELKMENGYGSATSVSVSPGYHAKVDAHVKIKMVSITQQTFDQIVDEAKRSDSYQRNSQFRKELESATYTSAGSSTRGIFGWLLGGGSGSFSNKTENLTEAINDYEVGQSSSDTTVANSIASIMVNNQSEVEVTGTISVTGELLVPSPTTLVVETTTFKMETASGNAASVSIINQAPVVPVDTQSSTVSDNTVAPGSRLNVTPLG